MFMITGPCLNPIFNQRQHEQRRNFLQRQLIDTFDAMRVIAGTLPEVHRTALTETIESEDYGRMKDIVASLEPEQIVLSDKVQVAEITRKILRRDFS